MTAHQTMQPHDDRRSTGDADDRSHTRTDTARSFRMPQPSLRSRRWVRARRRPGPAERLPRQAPDHDGCSPDDDNHLAPKPQPFRRPSHRQNPRRCADARQSLASPLSLAFISPNSIGHSAQATAVLLAQLASTKCSTCTAFVDGVDELRTRAGGTTATSVSVSSASALNFSDSAKQVLLEIDQRAVPVLDKSE